MGSDYVMDKDTDAKLFAAALYVISDMWGKEMGDMQRASLANQIVREIERRAILAAPPSPRSDYVMVPRKASDEMVEQARMTLPGPVDICDADIEDIYETMLSAAPSVTGEREPVAMPAYGRMSFQELGRDCMEASMGARLDFDFQGYSPGHAPLPSMNFNSLNRIVSKYASPSHVKDGTEDYRRGQRDALSAVLSLNPEAAAEVAKWAEKEPDPVGRIPFDVALWVSRVATQLGFETLEGDGPDRFVDARASQENGEAR